MENRKNCVLPEYDEENEVIDLETAVVLSLKKWKLIYKNWKSGKEILTVEDKYPIFSESCALCSFYYEACEDCVLNEKVEDGACCRAWVKMNNAHSIFRFNADDYSKAEKKKEIKKLAPYALAMVNHIEDALDKFNKTKKVGWVEKDGDTIRYRLKNGYALNICSIETVMIDPGGCLLYLSRHNKEVAIFGYYSRRSNAKRAAKSIIEAMSVYLDQFKEENQDDSN